MMTEGLEVVIQYRSAKYHQVASPATASAEFAILKKDLAHLRVHSPSQKNVRRVDGSFILHWPTAGTSPKVDGLTDSLHTRWFKLCSDDPEALKLREFLSIESISLTQNGVLICSTAGARQASQNAPPGTPVEGTPPQQPAPAILPAHPLPAKPPLPPKRPPSGPRLDRQPPPHLKRRMSDKSTSSPAATRQKMDTPETQTTDPPRPINTPPAPPDRPSSPRTDRQREPSASGDAKKPSPQTTRDDETTTRTRTPPQPKPPAEAPPAYRSPIREPGEMSPQKSHSGSTPNASSNLSAARQPPRHPRTTSPYPGAAKPDVSGLMRELWDTRRQLTAMQAREQVILDDLERMGMRPGGGGGDARSDRVTRDDLLRLEAELKAERDRRARAERVLSDVERECRAPFVVPALFQAFMKISELSS